MIKCSCEGPTKLFLANDCVKIKLFPYTSDYLIDKRLFSNYFSEKNFLKNCMIIVLITSRTEDIKYTYFQFHLT